MSEEKHLSDVMSAILCRRSIRRYKPDPIPQSVVENLLTAAIWAPSAHNRQPWRFAVIETPSCKAELAHAMGEKLRNDLKADNVPDDTINDDVQRSYDRLTSAPILIVLCLSMSDMDVYPDTTRAHNEYIMATQSTAMAGQNMLLAAHDSGLGACWACAPLFCPDVVQQVLNLPDDWKPQGLLTIGYPAESREKTRHPLEKQVVWR